jgi:hypothetical protein
MRPTFPSHEQNRSSKRLRHFFAQRRAAVRERLARSTVPLGGGRTPLALPGARSNNPEGMRGWQSTPLLDPSLPTDNSQIVQGELRAQFAATQSS